MIDKNKLKKLIEPHFYDKLITENYEIETLKANELLTNNRLDLAFKLIFLEMLEYDVSFAKKIYKEHIKAFSFGKFSEPGNENKNSIDIFFDDFYKTYSNIKNNGFDSSETLIPLSKDGSIANGAHRLASAIFLNLNIDCVKLDVENHTYDYKFFYKRNIPMDMLDIAVTKFVEYSSNVHIAFLWPTAIGNDEIIEDIIPNILYRKELKLNSTGAHNLLSQIYYGEDWLGSPQNNFKGSQGKLLECFKSFDPVRVIAFQSDCLNDVLILKEKIRKIFNIGKHSVHITDTKDEAVRTARIVFNRNSIHFLNNAKPNKYLSSHKKIDDFSKFINKNKLNINDVVLDSSIILSIYGLREAKDIDYFTVNNNKVKNYDDKIEHHDEELQYHKEKKLEMIFNPKYHFYFNDIKFISFSQLYKMKKNRAEEKDKNDCIMMEALTEDNVFKEYIGQIKQKNYYLKLKLRHYLILVLKNIGIYNTIKKIYLKIKVKNG